MEELNPVTFKNNPPQEKENCCDYCKNMDCFCFESQITDTSLPSFLTDQSVPLLELDIDLATPLQDQVLVQLKMC